MDPPPLHPNDDDLAVAASEPYLPLMDDDLTEPLPVPFPPPEDPYRDFQPFVPKRYALPCQTSCQPPPFNNNSYSIYHHIFCSTQPPDFSNFYNSLGLLSFNNNLDLKGHVMIKVRTTPADIIKLENDTRIIPEEEAVCRFCFHQLFPVNNYHNNNNNINVLKTKCLCPFTLTHEHCATEWSGKKGNIKCDVCDQDTNYIPVTLSTPPCSSEEKPDNGSFICTLENWSCLGTGLRINHDQ